MKTILSIDISNGDEYGVCVMRGDTILYIGSNFEKIKSYRFDEVIVSEPISRLNLMSILED